MPGPVDYETFCLWAERMVEELPPVLLRELSGGLQISEDAPRRPDDPPDVYHLGEYVVDPYLGRMILIHYGSFRRVFAGEPASVWREQLRETILHELRHHVEDLAGVDWLDAEDAAELSELWREALRSQRRDRRS